MRQVGGAVFFGCLVQRLQLLRSGHPGKYQQRVHARPIPTANIGVDAITHHQGPLQPPPFCGHLHQQRLGLAGDRIGHPTGGVRHRLHHRSIPRCQPLGGRQREIAVRRHPHRTALDGIGGLRKVGPSKVGAETLNYGRHRSPRFANRLEARFAHGFIDARATNHEDPSTRG